MTTFNNIVIVAHDSMKPDLVSFLKDRQDWLWGRTLVATGQTAEYIKDTEFTVPVQHVSRGREGGYKELAEMVKRGEVRLVIFFRDPEIIQDYQDEVVEFIKTCNRENTPLATNPASAELLILGMIRMESAQQTKTRNEAE